MNQEERISKMANVMIEARRANEDIGEVLVASLHDAAEKLNNVEALVAGRPGSWEADIVRRMATAPVGSHDVKRYAPYTQKLAPLFMTMAEAKEDGGDVLSQAMGKAVNELGGLDQFACGSDWYWDLVNIGCQYSDYPYPMGGNDIKG